MQANWSLILNVLLLVGVVVAIVRMMKLKRQDTKWVKYQPSIGQPIAVPQDEIIAVRKVNKEVVEEPLMTVHTEARVETVLPKQNFGPSVAKVAPSIAYEEDVKVSQEPYGDAAGSIMMFLLAKGNRQLAGYELLQTVLAAGLRFGEGSLFHRHQSPNGQGPVLFSLAAATPSGTFDMQNIGAFSVHGLCLFMEASGNPTIDQERFSIMLETAKQLCEGLDTYLLDDERHALSQNSIDKYSRLLHLDTACELAL